MKKQEGITLIALVITIIILIILAGITINAIFGENGLILRAREAAFKTEAGSIKEQVEMAKIQIGSNGKVSISINTTDLESIIPANQKAKYYYTVGNKLGIGNKKLGYYNVSQSEGGFSSIEKQWLEEIGIHMILPTPDIDWLEVGAYVAYTPDTVSSPVTIANSRTGYNGGVGDQVFNQDANAMSAPGNAKWRVVDKDETTVTLISETTLNGSDNIDDIYGGIWLYEAVGYNNAVTTGATEGILDEICRRLYSNSSLGVTARSATGEEIDKVSGVTEWDSGEWDTYLAGFGIDMQNRTSEDYRTNGNHDSYGVFAPDTYIAGTDIPGNTSQIGLVAGANPSKGYTRDEATEILGDTFEFRNLNVKAYLFGDMPNDDATTLEVVTGTDVGNYWLSSRFVVANSFGAAFRVRMVFNNYGFVIGYDIFDSNGGEDGGGLPVRAIVTIPASALMEHAGTKSNPHIIQP